LRQRVVCFSRHASSPSLSIYSPRSERLHLAPIIYHKCKSSNNGIDYCKMLNRIIRTFTAHIIVISSVSPEHCETLSQILTL
jgi:hypothetical protein